MKTVQAKADAGRVRSVLSTEPSTLHGWSHRLLWDPYGVELTEKMRKLRHSWGPHSRSQGSQLAQLDFNPGEYQIKYRLPKLHVNSKYVIFFFFCGGVGCGDGGGVEITSHAVFIFLYFYLLNLASLNLDPAWVNPAWLQNLCSQLGLGKGANTISWSVPRADTGKHNQRREREQQLELCVFLCWDTRRWFQAQSLKQLARPFFSMCYSSN